MLFRSSLYKKQTATPADLIWESKVRPDERDPYQNASSAEFVGRFWFWESSQVVIQGNFHGVEGAKAVGSSGNYSDFVIEALNGNRWRFLLWLETNSGSAARGSAASGPTFFIGSSRLRMARAHQ